MDLSKLKPIERIVEILHPQTEEPIGVRVTVMSLNDERLKKVRRKFLDSRLQLEARGKHLKAETVEENRDELAFSAMIDWEWYLPEVNFEGTKPSFNKSNVFKVFAQLPWFRLQIEQAFEDEKAFFSN